MFGNEIKGMRGEKKWIKTKVWNMSPELMVFSSEGDAKSQIHVKIQHIFYKENLDGFMYKRRFLFYNRIAPI